MTKTRFSTIANSERRQEKLSPPECGSSRSRLRFDAFCEDARCDDFTWNRNIPRAACSFNNNTFSGCDTMSPVNLRSKLDVDCR